MGRRKWKLYQESMSRNQLQNHQLHHVLNNNLSIKKEEKELAADKEQHIKQEPTNGQKDIIDDVEQERLKDWSPQSKCYFCVDGKLDSEHTNHGALVSTSNILSQLSQLTFFLV